MQADDFDMDDGPAVAVVEATVLPRLRDLEALATESKNAEFYFEIMALRERLGLPLEDKK